MIDIAVSSECAIVGNERVLGGTPSLLSGVGGYTKVIQRVHEGLLWLLKVHEDTLL